MPKISKTSDNYATTIYNMILDQIIDGELKPGDKLSDIEISNSLGCSRTPVREALIQLERDAFVKTINKKGTFVSELKMEDVREVYIVREILEAAAVRLGAVFVSNEELSIMENVLERMDLALSEGRFKDYPKLDLEFHKLLVHTAKVKLLSDICARMSLLGSSILIKGDRYSELAHTYNQEHRVIFEALKAHDADLAEKVTKEHIQRGKVNLMLAMM